MSLPRVLVYGGRGALGSAAVDFFKSKGWVSRLLALVKSTFYNGVPRAVYVRSGSCPSI